MSQKPIRVLVVEDEVLLLKNIKKKITAASDDFQVVGDAFNGSEALAMMDGLRPDVVFTDIRMPGMDGLELCRILSEKYPDVYLVIVSGYDDFEYARTAIRYHVFSYLLKPLKPEALKELLDSLKKEIGKSQHDQISGVLLCQLNGEPLPAKYFTDLTAENSVFSCFLVCIGNLHSHCHASLVHPVLQENYNFIPWKDMADEAPFEISDYWIFPQRFHNVKLVMLKSPSCPADEAASYFFEKLTKQMNPLPVTLVYDRKMTDFANLHTHRIKLRKRLFSSVCIGKSAIYDAEEPPIFLPPAILSQSQGSYFTSLIQSENSSGFGTSLGQLFQEWEDKNHPQQWIEKMLMQLFTLMQQCLYFPEQDYEKMQLTVYSSLELQLHLSASAVPIIKEFQYWIDLNKSTPTEIEDTISDMDAYIRSHYKEPLNISELAKKYHFNHSYLTRMFKKQTGISPLKLINELRISDAKKLLTDTELSIREISETAGFTDQHYFSRIFKDFTGTNPKEYRAINMEKTVL